MKKLTDLPIEIQEKLKNYSEELLKNYDIESIILIGAWAIEEAPEEEEINILIISEDFAKMGTKERVKNVAKFWNPPPILNPFPHTKIEFIKLMKRYQGYVFDALESGVVIYDKGFFKRVRDAFDTELKQFKIDEESLWTLY